jgi:hypothetical protein
MVPFVLSLSATGTLYSRHFLHHCRSMFPYAMDDLRQPKEPEQQLARITVTFIVEDKVRLGVGEKETSHDTSPCVKQALAERRACPQHVTFQRASWGACRQDLWCGEPIALLLNLLPVGGTALSQVALYINRRCATVCGVWSGWGAIDWLWYACVLFGKGV